MKEFVEYIVKNLVDYPDKVRINEVGGTHTLIIELAIEKSDIGWTRTPQAFLLRPRPLKRIERLLNSSAIERSKRVM